MGSFEHLLHEFELPLSNPVLIFSLILFIILLSPILLRKIKIPGIIGLIISGVIIGPHGLNLLEQNSAITLFSTIGLLYIMFIAGIELDMFEFRKNKYKSLGFGFFTFIFPLAIGIPVCYYLLNYDLSASILIASMFATHTLVAYPIANKFGISKNESVAITVGGTILTDTAVLIILAVIVGSAEGGLTNKFWMQLGISLSIFGLIIFFLIPRIAKWFFIHLEGEQTLQYVLVLSLVFLAAFLAEIAGVEPIIGAFMAGLALNRLIPHSSALMNRLEFVGNAIFIPFFLISVGMLVDISILLQGPTAIIVAITLSVVALTGKWIAAFVTQLLFKYTKSQRQLIFGLSSGHAAATLAVILVGYRAGIIDENILNGTIILILITCIIASFATENAAKALLQEQELPENDQAEPDIPEENVLIPIANFENLEPILDLTILLKSKNRPFTIYILSVVKYDNEAEPKMLKIRQKLDYFVRYASATETKLKPLVTLDVNYADGIIRTSKEILAETIIMGWPRKGTFIDKIFGKTTESIVSSTDRTIFLCNIRKPLNTNKAIKILCPLNAELEPGFHHWLKKIFVLAGELSTKIQFFCDHRTEVAITSFQESSKSKIEVDYSMFSDLEDFLILTRHIDVDDIFVVISARYGSVSYNNTLAGIPTRLNKHFSENNLMLIYPSIRSDERYDEYKDVKSDLINRSIKAMSNLQKGVKNVFR
jgi:Kef-type K+ transport system membrane component KefB